MRKGALSSKRILVGTILAGMVVLLCINACSNPANNSRQPGKYTVTIEETAGGTVSCGSTTSFAKDADVTLTVTLEEQKKLTSLTVTDAKEEKVELNPADISEEITEYTFKMPASNVTVKATFATIIETIDPPDPPDPPETNKPALPNTDPDNVKQVGGDIEIKWGAVPDAVSYEISRAGSRLGTYAELGTAAETTFTDNDPNPNEYENYYRIKAINSAGETVGTDQLVSLELSMFGANMKFYDSKYDDVTALRTEINNIHDNEMYRTPNGHWSNSRYALYFKPGEYLNSGTLKIGFYTQVAGLGKVPTETKLFGTVETPPYLTNNNGNNVTQNFWRVIENLEISSGQFRWAVSQAAPARRIKATGNATFDWNGGWASGGFLSDCYFAAAAGSWSQQQWYARNSHFTQAFHGVNWNKVIQASTGVVEEDNTAGSRTKIDTSPIIREKPFLYMEDGEYKVFVPAIRTDAVGPSWTDTSMGEGRSLDLVQTFHIARADIDTADTINAALADGKHIFFTPGRYELSAPIHITKAGTVVLGTGLATLIPAQANTYGALFIDDVDNVTVAGLMFDALYNSTYLICAGGSNASNSHSTAPTLLSDIFLRVGGVRNNCNVDIAALINSNNVIGDHFWVWRADHGGGGGNTGWTNNTSKNGVIVKGNDVTFYGLFVEHFQEYETLWLGENGRTYFYQNEKPYDPTSQSVYMSRGTVQGWAAYKVANTVNNHYAVGMGVYAVFSRAVSVQNAIEVPNKSGVRIENVCTLHLTNAGGYIRSIVNGAGQSTEGGYISERRYLRSYSNGTAVVGSGPTTGTQPANETFTIPTNLVP